MIFKNHIAVFVLYLIHTTSWASIKLTNIKCIVYDKTFATIPLCELKIVKRDVVAFNLNISMHQLPVNKISINMELLKKANGYSPFLYNVTIDFCKFMRQIYKITFQGVVLNAIAKTSNVNHTCPYDHDILVKNLILNNEMLRLLHLPSGDYLLNFRVAAPKDWKLCVKIYSVVKE